MTEKYEILKTKWPWERVQQYNRVLSFPHSGKPKAHVILCTRLQRQCIQSCLRKSANEDKKVYLMEINQVLSHRCLVVISSELKLEQGKPLHAQSPPTPHAPNSDLLLGTLQISLCFWTSPFPPTTTYGYHFKSTFASLSLCGLFPTRCCLGLLGLRSLSRTDFVPTNVEAREGEHSVSRSS